MLSLRERIELDLEVRLMGETLVLNRSLDPFFNDYIELNHLNVPLELKRDQVDDQMPTIEEGELIEEFRARNDARMVIKISGYHSDCNHDKKIPIDCAHNLKFSCMIDFEVLEDMNAYRDEGMGDVIFGQPFLREVRINARQFQGMVKIYNVIMEYLVKISKKARILELKQRYVKINVLATNTSITNNDLSLPLDCERSWTSIRDQQARSQYIGKDLVSGLLVYEYPLSSLRKKYHLNLKNDMPLRDK
uniref:Uncharacterized protein n=1 Tax=Tanacetum cinerariifolium TaxID=118510 RepID=A0A6L2NFP3_TANCI|nr:hypothetical protein [Tanacetum cinerariifolium]